MGEGSCVAVSGARAFHASGLSVACAPRPAVTVADAAVGDATDHDQSEFGESEPKPKVGRRFSQLGALVSESPQRLTQHGWRWFIEVRQPVTVPPVRLIANKYWLRSSTSLCPPMAKQS